jgi:hypothetical protein
MRDFDEVIEAIHIMREYNVEEALRLLIRYGQIDGEHHKTWVIDQAVRLLTGNYYDELIAAANDGEDGPETYDWDVGVAP